MLKITGRVEHDGFVSAIVELDETCIGLLQMNLEQWDELRSHGTYRFKERDERMAWNDIVITSTKSEAAVA